ncbi:Helix-turn-helix domain protein (plasmid) [Croceibacterium atlanticum]|uniref:Helix-turn-helix domain protein n=1 Tax=Croceibacterium atlanticum TaxID=1267766 RepID=A0A0F7KX98_9SPHN|nr:helix-turn-helix transcriptional regulator [Croceibacterium atlanticum]AKH44314.1 Helix-turn-helix domain protein [Croceibacterium atlanticum]
MAKGVHDKRYQKLLAALIAARQDRGMSQSELASRLGRPQQFVSRYELSKRRLDIIEYVDVAQNLDLDPPAELGKIL